MLGRNVQRMRRAPGLFVITLTMPVTMLLFFGYVFGSAVVLDGGTDYRAYLVPGLFVATAVNGVMTSMLSSAQDYQRGVMDRFRTLPMSRFAIPAGQTGADVLLAAVGLIPLALCGYAVGWRVEGGALPALGAFALLLLFRLVTAWLGHWLGLLLKTEEAAGQMGGATFMLPLLSNAYVPTEGMPGWLRTVAEWNPVSAVTAACRDLFGNAHPAAGASWPVAHPLAASLAWAALVLAVVVPLTVRRYGRTAG
ncbi:ABC transporter permease [Streptomyces sp. NPDC053048]|uniref:ABC transporter permease n=1 Tax=Streptomyces sp. NPDC053048 TaxID=3365694 RepID=UPI0037D72A7A